LARPSSVSQVETVESQILALDTHHDPEALRVVIEAAEARHEPVEGPLPGMPERRMPEVVRQRQRLRQVLVEPELPRHRARDLRHLEAVRQPCAVVIALVVDEHLRLVDQPPERRRMQDAVAVALERAARRAVRLGEAPAPGRDGAGGIGRGRALAGRQRAPIRGFAVRSFVLRLAHTHPHIAPGNRAI
jgi:hypothetical protein